MKISEMMVRDVKFCAPDDSLADAARLMWEHDFGCVPVVDKRQRVVGMLTDRDICMAGYTQGVALSATRISSAMSRQVFSCRPDDDIAAAEKLMRDKQIRRLPVLDKDGHLVGLVSLNDIVREAARERGVQALRHVTDTEIVSTLSAISAHRTPAAAAYAA